jgi:hypothetical protein
MLDGRSGNGRKFSQAFTVVNKIGSAHINLEANPTTKPIL